MSSIMLLSRRPNTVGLASKTTGLDAPAILLMSTLGGGQLESISSPSSSNRVAFISLTRFVGEFSLWNCSSLGLLSLAIVCP